MDPQEWQTFIAEHGGIIGHTPVYTKAETDGAVDKNAHPPMSLVFKDGSTMEAIFEDDGSVSVTKPLKSGPKEATAAKPQLYTDPSDGSKWSVDANGNKTRLTDAAAEKEPTPKNLVPGSGTPGTPDYSGASTGGSDQSGPQMVGGTPDVPVDVYGAQTARQNADRAAAQQAWQQGQAKIQNDLAANRLTLDQARDAANELHQRISEDLARSAQEITKRGQDINSADTQRGQDLSYLGRQSYVTAGQYGQLQAAQGAAAQAAGVPFTPTQAQPLGYDPSAIARQIAQRVMAQGGGPVQPQGAFTMPPNTSGPGPTTPEFVG